MNPESLVRIANDIGAFFANAATREEAAQGVLAHLKRYWDPRMKTQIVAHYRAGGGATACLRCARLARSSGSWMPSISRCTGQ